jgi:ketosteroid isomerase-like protein
MGETETLVNPRPGESKLDTQLYVSGPKTAPGSHANVQRSGSRTAIIVAITAFVMLMVFGVLGLAGYLYLRDQRQSVVANVNLHGSNNVALNKNTARSPAPSPTASVEDDRVSAPALTANRSKTRPVDDQTRDEVTRQIDSWRSQTESMDMDSLMDHYATNVDYYNKRGAGIDFIRADKSRAFSRYNDIRLSLSNMDVETNGSDDSVTAIFDKEWHFRGERNSKGKVRQMLQLKKIGGRWLITVERDLKVY